MAKNAEYSHHNTPALYGFQSYMSVPVFRLDGALFWTLCAIDPRPAPLDDQKIIGMFRLFAELIAAQLDSYERLADSEAGLVN